MEYTITDSNEVVRAGDTVVMMKSSENDSGEYVAFVRSIKAHADGNVMAKVKLYCRPEDTSLGRKPMHGAKELFLTNKIVTQSVHKIKRKCIVHNLKNYTRLKDVGLNDYFSRFQYNTRTLWFSPDFVEVFCKCELPLNPDDFMLKCKACKDWYHPACINMTIDEANQLDNFTCGSCQFVDGKIPDESSS